MTTFAVLATGPSMSQEIADYVRGKCSVVAVNDAFRLAPWADALVANDRAWWNLYPEAMSFAGRKFAGTKIQHIEHLPVTQEFVPGTNSGLQGVRVARLMGATKILLCGFDMHGSHYFGRHPTPLKETSEVRRKEFIRQFGLFKNREMVVNCTDGSAIPWFRFSTLEAEL